MTSTVVAEVEGVSLNEAGTRREPLLNRIFVALEIRRIRNHFRSVEIELGSREPCGLTPGQRRARRLALGRLREYRSRGRFPRNLDLPQRATPYVRGRDGTPCAVAYLIERSGGSAVVDDLEDRNNNIWVEDIEEPRFDTWLRDSGLTKAEAAKIQVPYMYSGPDPAMTALGLLLITVLVAGPLQIVTARLVRRFQPRRTSKRGLTLASLLLVNLAAGLIVAMVALWLIFGTSLSLPNSWWGR